jgi:hypothetical protein
MNMNFKDQQIYKTQGTGSFTTKDFFQKGENVIFEKGVLVFHPENISIGCNAHIGHNTILKGYQKDEMNIDDLDNRDSLRGIAKVGFKPLGKGTYIQFGGRLIYKYEQLKLCNTTRGGKH